MLTATNSDGSMFHRLIALGEKRSFVNQGIGTWDGVAHVVASKLIMCVLN